MKKKLLFFLVASIDSSHLNSDQIKFFEAIKAGNSNIINNLLEKSAVNVNELDENGDSALHIIAQNIATISSSKAIVEVLLEHHANINSENSKEVPISESERATELILNEKVILESPLHHKTPLYTLIFNSYTWQTSEILQRGLEVFKIFKEYHAIANPKNDPELPSIALGNYKYLMQTHQNNIDYLKILEKYQNIIAYLHQLGFTIITDDEKKFFQAIKEGTSVENLKKILTLPGVSITSRDQEGNTALHYATSFIHNNSFQIIEFLLHENAPINITDYSKLKRTPMVQLIINSDSWDTASKIKVGLDAFKLLKAHGAQVDPSKYPLLLNNALEIAKKIFNTLPWHITEYMQIIKYLLKNGFDPDIRYPLRVTTQNLPPEQYALSARELIQHWDNKLKNSLLVLFDHVTLTEMLKRFWKDLVTLKQSIS